MPKSEEDWKKLLDDDELEKQLRDCQREISAVLDRIQLLNRRTAVLEAQILREEATAQTQSASGAARHSPASDTEVTLQK